MKRNFNRIKTVICALGILMLWSSCTKYENPPAIYEDYEQEGEQTVKRKVLFISIDGAVGQEIKKKLPPNLTNLLKTSKYTFNAFADENTGDASSWMSMMSGVSYANHGINDDSYIPKPDENHPHENAVGYPSILYRIATIAPNTKTAVVSRTASLNDKLLVSADETYDANTDEGVKTQVIDLLEKKNQDLTIVQFKSVLDAGIENGFSVENASYTDALNKVDGYIGNILDAIKARKNYAYEDWLIIITSNHGGIGNSYGGKSDAERNTFAIFANPSFKEAELTGKAMSYVRLWGYDGTDNKPLGVRAVSENLGNSSDYDLSTSKELTISTRFRFNLNNTIISSTYQPNTYNYWYSCIFGKDSNTSTATPGWMYYTYGGDIQVRISDGTTIASCQAPKVNGEWYTMTSVITAIAPDKVNIKIFNNGTLAQETTTSGMNINNIRTNDPLIFGYRPAISYDLVDFDVSDVHIFNKAYSQQEIRDFICYSGNIGESSFGANLKGFWKMNPTSTGEITNEIAGKSNMQLSGAFSGRSVSEVKPCDLGNNAVFVQSTDFYTQIFYWMELQTQKDWNLEGQVFLNKYEVEFLKP